MTYIKAHGVWHVMYQSKMDFPTNMMKGLTICGEDLIFDVMARGEDNKSDQVCAECELLLRQGDKLLRDTFPDKK